MKSKQTLPIAFQSLVPESILRVGREGGVCTLEGGSIRPRPGIFSWNGLNSRDLGLEVLGQSDEGVSLRDIVPITIVSDTFSSMG